MKSKGTVTEEGQTIIRKFSEECERNAALNRTIIIGTTVFDLIIIIFTSFLFVQEGSDIYNNLLVLASILSIIVNWVCFLRNQYSIIFHRISIMSYMLLYIIGFILCKDEYMQYTMLAILIITMMFYKNKEMKIYCFITGLINIAYIMILYNTL